MAETKEHRMRLNSADNPSAVRVWKCGACDRERHVAPNATVLVRAGDPWHHE